ncbi:MAG: VCBS repeat-containing protein [Bacteroidetes bacterium]|nr:VCBS repeat-containing protein [Bacteroidota bacterium]
MKKILLSIAVLAAMNVKGTAQGLCFSPQVTYGTGAEPYSVCSADFNGDGHPDMATANASSSNISVLFNNGDGTFSSMVNYPAGSYPYSICAADFNGDGKQDLAVADEGDNKVGVYINSGTGTFAAAVTYTTANSPYCVVSADFNGDGSPDLATANEATHNVSILLNSGTGTFGSTAYYGVGSFPLYIATADFNGDGKPDVVAANSSSNNVSVILNSGTGTFGAASNYNVGAMPVSVTAADYNGDGIADIAAANYSGNNVSVLLNNGTGTSFSTAVSYSVGNGVYSVCSADFNGDTKMDLATVNFGSKNATVLLNSGSGTFGSGGSYMVGNGPYCAIATDFNGDSKIDLANVNSSDYNASVLLQCVTPGAALNFQASTSNNAIIPNFSTLTDNITFGAYVNWSGVNTGGNQMIVSNGNTGSSGYALFMDNSQYLSVVVGGVFILTSTVTVAPNVWTNVMVTSQGNNWMLYVNGAAYTFTTTVIPNTPSGSFAIGSNQGGTEKFDGDIDEVRFWNRALCQTEIQNYLYGELPMPQNGLLAYYKFNEGAAGLNNASVTTIRDSSGNSNDIPMANFTLNGANSNWVTPGAVTSASYAPAYVAPTITVGGNTSVCIGSTTTLTASNNVSTYTWSTSDNTASISVTPTVNTTYNVVGTTSVGCVSNAITTTVTVNSLPTVTATATSTTAICSGSNDILNASGASTYTWSTSATTVSITITPTVTTTYTVVGTDVNGCVNMDTVSVPVNALPNVTATAASAAICTGSSDSLRATGAVSYAWNTSATSANISVSPTAATSYTVTGTDANGCVNTATVAVNVNALPTLSLTASSPSVCVNGTPITLTGSPAGGVYSGTHVSGNTFTPTAATGTFNVVYSYTNSTTSCSNKDSVALVVDACTGIARYAQNNLSVYPNPASNQVTVQASSELGTITVYNAIGQVVEVLQVKDTQTQLNVSAYASGIYTILTQGTYIKFIKD